MVFFGCACLEVDDRAGVPGDAKEVGLTKPVEGRIIERHLRVKAGVEWCRAAVAGGGNPRRLTRDYAKSTVKPFPGNVNMCEHLLDTLAQRRHLAPHLFFQFAR